MAQGTTNITIKINGKEVENNIYSIRKAVRDLDTDINKLNRDSDEYNAKIIELRNANKILDQHKQNVSGVNKSWQSIKENVKAAGIVMAGYFGVTTLFSKMQGAIQGAAKMSDVMADVQRTTGMAADRTEQLKEELSSIDSRTATVDLLELAKAGGKLGIAQDDILGFVKAADQINVALGEDLGKDAITAIGKIVNIFHLKDEFGLEQAMLKVGSAINSAGQASEAQEGYIVDFLNRMGGIAPLANISATSIIGLGATLDSLGQTSEVSSTALSKIFTKMADDAATFSKFAGMSVEDFTNLMNNDAMEALLRVLEGANKTSNGIVELTKTMGEMDVEGGRAVGVFGTLANNTKRVREQIDIANKSFEQGTSITQEYTVKNETLGAALDKLMKRINGFVVNSALTHWLTDIVGKLGDTTTEVEKLTNEFNAQNAKAVELENKLNPLINRYDELTSAGVLNEAQQTELHDVIFELSRLLPNAVTEWDKYGKAIAISTDKARGLIVAEKQLAALMSKDVINATLQQIADAEKSLEYKMQSKYTGSYFKEGMQTTSFGKTKTLTSMEANALNKKDLDFIDKQNAIIVSKFKELNDLYDYQLTTHDQFVIQYAAQQSKLNISWLYTDETVNQAAKNIEAYGKLSVEELKKLASEGDALAQSMLDKLKKVDEENKDAEKKQDEYQRREEQLHKFIQDKGNELLLFGMDKNEAELAQIRWKYEQELEMAKGHAEEVKAIEALRDIELEQKRAQHQQKLLEMQAAFNEDFWLMLQDDETKARAAIDKYYEDWYTRMVLAGIDTVENWDMLQQKWDEALANFDMQKFAAMGQGMAKGMTAMFAATTAVVETQVDYSTKKYKELVAMAAAGDEEAAKAVGHLNDMLADQAEGYFKAALAAADSVELQKLTLRDLLNLVRQQIKAYISEAIAKVVADSLKTVPFPFNIALATTAGFTTSALFDKLIPKFALGGFTDGPGIYMAGEAGKEYIASNKQLRDPVTGPIIQGLDYHRTTGQYPEWMTSPGYEANFSGITNGINYSRNISPGYFGNPTATKADTTYKSSSSGASDAVINELASSIAEFNDIMANISENGIQAYLADERLIKLEKRITELSQMNSERFI